MPQWGGWRATTPIPRHSLWNSRGAWKSKKFQVDPDLVNQEDAQTYSQAWETFGEDPVRDPSRRTVGAKSKAAGERGSRGAASSPPDRTASVGSWVGRDLLPPPKKGNSGNLRWDSLLQCYLCLLNSRDLFELGIDNDFQFSLQDGHVLEQSIKSKGRIPSNTFVWASESDLGSRKRLDVLLRWPATAHL